MSDWSIYNNTTPVGLLTREQLAALKMHEGLIEYWAPDGSWLLRQPSWHERSAFRARRPLKKPFIIWSHVARKLRYLACDSNGWPYLYESLPLCREFDWQSQGGSTVFAHNFASYVPGSPDLDWRDSLVSRPGTEVEA